MKKSIVSERTKKLNSIQSAISEYADEKEKIIALNLGKHGFSVREIATLLELTPQRLYQKYPQLKEVSK